VLHAQSGPWATQTHTSTADTAESPLDLGDPVFGHPGLAAVPHAVRVQAEHLNAIVSYDDRLLKAATDAGLATASPRS
jgi:hypothetical protein